MQYSKTSIYLFFCVILFITLCSCNTNPSSSNRYDDIDIDVENHYITCKIWGLMKYYHPDIVQNKINWDSLILDIIPKIDQALDTEERNKILEKLLNSVKTPIDNQRNEIFIHDSLHIIQKTSFEWITESRLSNLLVRKLQQYISHNQNIYKRYYSFIDSQHLIDIDKTYPNIDSFPDLNYRLLTLYRYWNIVEYLYPYKYLIDNSWDTILKQSINEFRYAKDQHQYKKALYKLISSTNDSHASIYDPYISNFIGKKRVDASLTFIGDTCIVLYANPTIGLIPGDIIISTNSRSIINTINDYKYIIPASTKHSYLDRLACNLLRSNNDSIEVNIIRGQQYFSLIIPTTLLKKDKFISAKKPHTFIKNSVLYLNLCEEITEPIINYSSLKGIIFDLRGPININTLNSIDFSPLFSKPVLAAKFSVPILPGIFILLDNLPNSSIGKVNSHYFKNRVVLLVNSKTQSASEFIAMQLRQSPNCFIVGSNTAGANGDIISITLPGAITTSLSGLGVYNPDNSITQRKGISPDIFIQPSISGITQGRDEILEKGLMVITH